MATSYTSDKKIGALDPITGSLSATDEFVVNKNGDTLKTSVSQVEEAMFAAKTSGGTPQSGDVIVVRRGSLIRQLETQNMIPNGSIGNDQISTDPLKSIVDSKLSKITTAGKVGGGAIVDGTIAGSTIINTSGAIATSGGISGTLTGTLTGNVTGNVTGNAGTASTLQTARTIAISGDVTGTATSFNGSANISIPTAITADSIVNADINSAAGITDGKLATIATAGKVSNSATTATSANTANAIVARDASGNFSAGTITANVTGNVTGNVSGNAGTVTNGLYTNAVQTNTAQKSFQAGNSGMATATGGLNTLEVLGTGGAAMLTFHRPGSHATYVGIDSDNQLKVGGWSLGAAAFPILTSGNYNSYAPTLTGGGASGAWGIRAYPRRSDGGDINFFWNGQSGQPPWLWGSSDGQNFYVWNPSNFNVNYANSAGNGVPPGAIMPFAMNSAPAGWLAANGTAVSRSTYAALFAAISTTYGAGNGSTTFALPDLRGYFVRGSGTNSDGTASGAFGAKQTDEFKSHQHTSGYHIVTTGGYGQTNTGSTFATSTGTGTNTNATGGTETRPKNIAMLYCIKF